MKRCTMNVEKKYGKGTELIWNDRKRFMGMPLSFTRYYLIKKPGAWFKIFSDVGFTYSEIEEVNLYRIVDVSFHQSLFGKMFNTGTITLRTSDETQASLVLVNVKNPHQVRQMLAGYVEEERQKHHVNITEFHARGY